MTNLRRDMLVCACGCALGLTLALGGCKKKAPPPPPPPPPPPVIEQAPEPVDIDSLRQSMNIDARVQFPEQFAPVNPELARAVLSFADALVRGDDESLRGMLDSSGVRPLEDLVADGTWFDSTAKAEVVRVTFLAEVDDSGQAVERPVEIPEFDADEFKNQMQDMMGDVPAEMQGFANSIMEGFTKAFSDPQFQQAMREQAEAAAKAVESQESFDAFLATLPPESADQLRSIGYENFRRMSGSMGSMGGEATTGSVVVLAIQQPGEAYRLRWDAVRSGESYKFRPLDVSERVAARASAFDGDPAVPMRMAALSLPDEVGPNGESPTSEGGDTGPQRDNTNPRRNITPPSAPGDSE